MTQNNPQLDLPAADQAAQVHQGIVSDVFFAKMAELGVVPRGPEEAEAMWRTAHQCVELLQHPTVKQATLQQSPLLEAERRLTETLNQYGLSGTATKSAADQAALNQLTLAYAREPDVYKAMLSLAHAESQAAAG